MPYVALNPGAYDGQVVANGQCVRFVQVAAHAPISSSWKEGVSVRGASIPAGTVIATFVNGRYPNQARGNHAAIYVSQDATGIWVWDQWTGTPVHKRHIQFQTPASADRSNNGSAFAVVE